MSYLPISHPLLPQWLGLWEPSSEIQMSLPSCVPISPPCIFQQLQISKERPVLLAGQCVLGSNILPDSSCTKAHGSGPNAGWKSWACQCSTVNQGAAGKGGPERARAQGGTNCVAPSLLRLFWFWQWVHFTEIKLDKTEILHVLCLVEAPLSLSLCPSLGPFSSSECIYPGPLSYAHQVWLIFLPSPTTASALVSQRRPWPCPVGALQRLLSFLLLKFKFFFCFVFCDMVSSRPGWS